MDNTAKQNKSKYLLAFFGYLVLRGDFDIVMLSCLPVGHTHEDIDQFFSRIATKLRRSASRSRKELAHVIEESYKMPSTNARPLVQHLDRVANFSHWIEPYLRRQNFIGIGLYRQFRIYRNSHGEAVVQCRPRCGFRDETETAIFYAQPPLQMLNVPPAQRKEKVDEDMRRLRQDIEAQITDRFIPSVHAEDLRQCVDALESKEELQFNWPDDGAFAQGADDADADGAVMADAAALVRVRVRVPRQMHTVTRS